MVATASLIELVIVWLGALAVLSTVACFIIRDQWRTNGHLCRRYRWARLRRRFTRR